MQKVPSYSQRLRLAIQIVSLLLAGLVLCAIILGCRQAIHALCPFATVCFGLNKSVILGLVTPLFWLTVVLGLAALIHSMWYGRKFCGYICPLGTIQEALFSLRSRKYRTKNRVPYLWEKRFSQLKYLVLVITALLSLSGLAYIFIRFCPLYGLSLLPRLAIPGLAVLILILLSGLFLERFWCRYLCPYAALLNLFQGLGELFGIKRSKIRRNLERCVDCGNCMIYCPMNLNIAEQEFVQAKDCIHCLVCACKCPKAGTICCEREEC